MNSLESLESAARDQCGKYKEKSKKLSQQLEKLNQHLASSRQREAALQALQSSAPSSSSSPSAAAMAAGGDDDTCADPSAAASETTTTSSSSSSPTASSSSSSSSSTLHALRLSESRCSELQSELADTLANFNETVAELEDLTRREAQSRADSAAAAAQLGEMRQLQEGVMKENLALLEAKEESAAQRADSLQR